MWIAVTSELPTRPVKGDSSASPTRLSPKAVTTASISRGMGAKTTTLLCPALGGHVGSLPSKVDVVGQRATSATVIRSAVRSVGRFSKPVRAAKPRIRGSRAWSPPGSPRTADTPRPREPTMSPSPRR